MKENDNSWWNETEGWSYYKKTYMKKNFTEDELIKAIQEKYETSEKLKDFIAKSIGVNPEKLDAFIKNCKREEKLKKITK